jgi:hypothetical protein
MFLKIVLKPVFIIAIVAVVMIGVMVPSVFASFHGDPKALEKLDVIVNTANKITFTNFDIIFVNVDLTNDSLKPITLTLNIEPSLIDKDDREFSMVSHFDLNDLGISASSSECPMVLIGEVSPGIPEEISLCFKVAKASSATYSLKLSDRFGHSLLKQLYVIQTEEKSSKGGGCLIATATYGSEMSQQVQQLRELRDNQLLQTQSGTAFMGTFNDIYYSFSPMIADYERENPMFKEIVKIGLTPLLSSLAIMENANSESEVLGLGLSIIALNVGMYIGVPAIVVIGIRKRF